MSDERPELAQEQDELPTRRIFLIIVAIVAVTAAFIAWAALELAFRERRLGERAAPRAEERPQGGWAVELALFDHGEAPAARLAAEKRRLLASWAWVDEERGIVRIPIERAMELMASGAAPPAEGDHAR